MYTRARIYDGQHVVPRGGHITRFSRKNEKKKTKSLWATYTILVMGKTEYTINLKSREMIDTPLQ